MNIKKLASIGMAFRTRVRRDWQPSRRQTANIVVIFGDDIGIMECRRLHPRDDGQDAQHRQHRQTGRPVHRSIRPAQPAPQTRRVHHRPAARSHRHDDHRTAGSPRGIQKNDPTLAEVLKSRGLPPRSSARTTWATGTSSLPTVHGFDEWFGNLYHLNAEEGPSSSTSSKNPALKAKFGPRGVLHVGDDGRRCDHRSKFGPRRHAEDREHRPADASAPETFDRGSDRQDPEVPGPRRQGRQAVLRLVQHHRHPRLVTSAEQVPAAGRSTRRAERGRGAREDARARRAVGSILKDRDLGVGDNTIVITTDNGNEADLLARRRLRAVPAAKERPGKVACAFPLLVRWPGKIPAGEELNGIQCHETCSSRWPPQPVCQPEGRPAQGATMNGTSYKGASGRLQQPRLLDGQDRQVGAPRVFYYDETDLMAVLLRRVEASHRRQAQRQLVRRESRTGGPLHREPADGPDGKMTLIRTSSPTSRSSSPRRCGSAAALAGHRRAPEEPARVSTPGQGADAQHEGDRERDEEARSTNASSN